MSTLTTSQNKTADWLLRHSRGRPEEFIRKRIGELLGSLDIEYETGYPTEGGPADIYLPRRRTIIETKARGRANNPDQPQARDTRETPKEQMERYLRAEMAYERRCLPLDEQSDRPWTGIVTDGRVWHVWRYAHADNAVSTPIARDFLPAGPEALIERLQDYVDGELVGKPWVPADPRNQFRPWLEKLHALYADLPKRVAGATETKKRLWLDMLISASMDPGHAAARDRLFVAHSFLVAFARGVIHVLAHPGQEPRAQDILGDGFIAWTVVTAQGRQWGDGLLKEVNSYDWRRRPGDVLRPLYEAIVGERDRKAFGEFYTPDWLAELLVREVCDEQWCDEAVRKTLAASRKGREIVGTGVLDPTCGSGTFLYFAAKRLLARPQMKDLTNADKAAVVCALVHGFDVHPVAAEIARATLLRALPTEPPQGKAGLRIHEGDALMLRADDEHALFRADGERIRIATPKGDAVYLPKAFVDNPRFGDNLRRLILCAQHNHELSEDIVEGLSANDRKAVRACQQNFVEIIRNEGNSVWTWYILNTTGPYRLAERKIDRIVANPPWVTMAGVQARDRKRELEQCAQSQAIDLWMGGKQAPHFDIAQLFIKRTRQLYLASPKTNPAAWLVKKAALKAGSWEKFREWHRAKCLQTIDLEAVKPFGAGDARRCCVLFEYRTSSLGPRGERSLVARSSRGNPAPQESLAEAMARLSFHVAPAAIPQGQSDYVSNTGTAAFRQGATITPKVLTVVDQFDHTKADSSIEVTTAASQHAPWSNIAPQSGTVPARWVQALLVSDAVIPYAVDAHKMRHAIIPVGRTGLLEHAPERTCEFWREMEEIYDQNRSEGKGTPSTLLERIDYASELSAQLRVDSGARKMVVYPASGDIMRACRIRPGETVIDATLYRYVAGSAPEAAYIVGLMNAQCLSQAFSESRTSGRHFHLHPWRAIPIPKFDRKEPDHMALVRLTARAERTVERGLEKAADETRRQSQVALSRRARELLHTSGISEEIDAAARKILPWQARQAQTTR